MDMYKGIPILDDSQECLDTFFPEGASFGCVPRDYTVQPANTFGALPSSMVLIPESELDARYDEQEAQQSSLEHLYLRGGKPAFVNLDQNGHGDCATADTEVLTEKGFIPWPEYNWQDLLATVNPVTHAMEFQAPYAKHVKEYDGPMIYSTNRRVDFGMTPGHRMLVRKWDEKKRTLSDSYTFQKAGELGWYAGLMNAPRYFIGTELVELAVDGDRPYDGDDFLAMLALICSDGYAGGSGNTRNWVSFCCFREDRHAIVDALARRIGFHENPSRRGVWTRYNAGALAEWVRSNCYTNPPFRSKTKRIPAIVKSASMRQINHFLSFYGDQNHSGETAFYSTSKRIIDDLQELHLRVGKRGTISKRESRGSHMMADGKVMRTGESFALHVSRTDRLCLERKKHIETEHYKGEVYCASVPNGTLVTRRNGSVLISGNCWAFSTGHAIMMNALRRGSPIPRLNPHAIAVILNQLNGGWWGLSAKFARENGCPVDGNGPGEWPGHSRSRQYDTPALRAAMAAHKITEEFVDLSLSVYDQKLTRQQYWTALMSNQPSPSDFREWGHSVCAIRWVRIERGSWGPLIINSWKDWGRNGLAVIRNWFPMGAGSILVSGSA